MKRTLAQLAEMCGGTLTDIAAYGNDGVEGVFTDSRKPVPGSLFIPLVGERFDGHEFVQTCLEKGAAGTLWQKDHGTAPQGAVIIVEDTLVALQELATSYLKENKASVVGITGSNGKTTTKDIVDAILSTTFKVHKTQGNFNNHIGLPLTVLSMEPDTEIVILEMGMSGRGEIEELSVIAQPDVAIITNIGESHLLQLGSRLEIARAKVEIAAGMKPGGLLIYNGDEPLIEQVLAEPATKLPEGLQRYTFGLQADNDDYPTGIMNAQSGVAFTTKQSGEVALTMPLLGTHNVVNCLAALAVARHFGVAAEQIVAGLSRLKLTGMRIEIINGVSGLTMLNDAYNASPTSMKAAVDVLESLKGYRIKVAVLGDMLELGPQEHELHRGIGEYITPDKMNMVLAYGPLSASIAEGARQNMPAEAVHAFESKEELTHYLLENLHSRDVVLFKASRGMKLEDVVDALKIAPLQNRVD
ncbi:MULTISPECIES: UDP-N-acetylmuramoyl-tripeptide--D-alanyl-D-alanine ligase [unclassified Paenibacillus]|uniref:UDP-N-acetylmuramoyl-tripeptide--D-alanyl-D- alanine ligase n=1 Tax=unclassified Paenibacillus TaxID=185978 RepID=UPI0004644725|nr:MULTISPECIES: UDP-N-acetylmuramoyl-tripeptide--D-alanyl-D-alanine ligase [unclassified Paenibacillus]KGP85195.1 UDP-N-acetylmuramoyl-tripeptide--D-alanyl-D-alanine ligase [Paenibacillus sp. MAEPY2]KGP85918.1 UDP-N-acetylmuramoyl-tripeptide--D-alanyl-D-alanine ligase [Paenibacillus sp. MAEPY1]